MQPIAFDNHLRYFLFSLPQALQFEYRGAGADLFHRGPTQIVLQLGMACERFEMLSTSQKRLNRYTTLQILRRNGINVWFDKDNLQPGATWMATLEDAIGTASAMIVYIGHLGIQAWVDREVRVGLLGLCVTPANLKSLNESSRNLAGLPGRAA